MFQLIFLLALFCRVWTLWVLQTKKALVSWILKSALSFYCSWFKSFFLFHVSLTLFHYIILRLKLKNQFCATKIPWGHEQRFLLVESSCHHLWENFINFISLFITSCHEIELVWCGLIACLHCVQLCWISTFNLEKKKLNEAWISWKWKSLKFA